MRSGQGGDHMIARDVTALFTEGWDWMQPVRDRDTGIFDSVELAFVGPLALQDPHVSVDQLQAVPLQHFDVCTLASSLHEMAVGCNWVSSTTVTAAASSV